MAVRYGVGAGSALIHRVHAEVREACPDDAGVLMASMASATLKPLASLLISPLEVGHEDVRTGCRAER